MPTTRKKRNQDPEVLQAIYEGLDTDASPPAVHRSLQQKQARGELRADLYIPSVRTIQNIAADRRRDDSGAWTFEDSAPAEAALILRVLSAVATKSSGRVKHLTKREARLAAVYQTVRPGIDGIADVDRLWAAYVRARSYLALLNRGEDPVDEHLRTADLAAVDEGLEYRPGMIDPTLKEHKNG
jgi:hypothetical protein